jgi:hypothetical protein
MWAVTGGNLQTLPTLMLLLLLRFLEDGEMRRMHSLSLSYKPYSEAVDPFQLVARAKGCTLASTHGLVISLNYLKPLALDLLPPPLATTDQNFGNYIWILQTLAALETLFFYYL